MKSASVQDKSIQCGETSSWLERVSRKVILNQLSKLKVGRLRVLEGGDVWEFGSQTAQEMEVDIYIHDIRSYSKILFGGTIGAGESYMQGYWHASDLTSLVRLMLINRSALKNMESKFSWIKKRWSSLMAFSQLNSLSGSKKNIGAHYDLSNDFFALFLDRSMMYSAAIYPKPSSSLEEASDYKLKHICERLQLNEKDHLIEIGSGWGGMAIYAAKHYGCHVTTTTISDEQFLFAKSRIEDEGLQHKITLLNKDYRLLEGQYDKLVSIEMIEAVGHQYYSQFFSKCNDLLKHDGLGLIQAITTGDHRFELEKNKIDFIRRYIFPGGCLPSNRIVAEMLSKHTNMQCVGLEDITLHYAETLKEWRLRFLDALPEVKRMGFDDVFVRMWEFYLAYCEGGFREREIYTSQFLFAKPGVRSLP